MLAALLDGKFVVLFDHACYATEPGRRLETHAALVRSFVVRGEPGGCRVRQLEQAPFELFPFLLQRFIFDQLGAVAQQHVARSARPVVRVPLPKK